MPATKDVITVASAVALAGDDGQTVSGYADLRTAYGGIWLVTLTNSANKLSKGVQVQAQVSDVQSADAWNFDCRHIGDDAISAVSRFAIRIPAEVNFSRLVVDHGDEIVTLDAKLIRLTQV